MCFLTTAARSIGTHLIPRFRIRGYSLSPRLSLDNIPTTMKAIVQTNYGKASESLTYSKVPTPIISPFDVLVRVRAASLNLIDSKLRWGWGKDVLKYPGSSMSKVPLKAPPFIVGRDFSGEVVQVGSCVPEFPHYELGEKVMGFIGQFSEQGSWCEYVKVPFWELTSKPDYLTFEEAASLPFVLTGVIELLSQYSKNTINERNENIIILGGSTGGSVASYLALLLYAEGLSPKLFTMKDKPSKILSDSLFNTQPFNFDEFCNASAEEYTTVFLPNGISKCSDTMLEIHKKKVYKVFDSDNDDYLPDKFNKNITNIYQILNNSLAVYQYLPSHQLKQNTRNLSMSEVLQRFHGYNFQNEGLNVKLHLCDTPQMMLYPELSIQRGYHIGMRNIIDSLQQFVVTRLNLPNLSQIDKIFPFSEAIEAHETLDNDNNNGKIVLSFDKLFNENEKENENINYKTYPILETYSIPSSSLVPLLRTGNIGNITF